MLMMGREIPLADFSPFAVLPEEPEVSRRAFGDARPAAHIDLRERPRSTGAGRPQADNRTGPASTPSPVFSFRKSPTASERMAEAQLGRRASVGGSEALPSSRQSAGIDAPFPNEEPATSRRSLREASPLAQPGTAEPGTSPEALVVAQIQAATMEEAKEQGTATSVESANLRVTRSPGTLFGQAEMPFEILDALASDLLAAQLTPAFRVSDAAPGSQGQDVSSSRRFDDSQERSSAIRDAVSSGPGEREIQAQFEASQPEYPFLCNPRSLDAAAQQTVASPPEASALAAISSRLHLDAETLASLVNQVLAEQARRHGVDLS